jgi:hypothetical protein
MIVVYFKILFHNLHSDTGAMHEKPDRTTDFLPNKKQEYSYHTTSLGYLPLSLYHCIAVSITLIV